MDTGQRPPDAIDGRVHVLICGVQSGEEEQLSGTQGQLGPDALDVNFNWVRSCPSSARLS